VVRRSHLEFTSHLVGLAARGGALAPEPPRATLQSRRFRPDWPQSIFQKLTGAFSFKENAPAQVVVRTNLSVCRILGVMPRIWFIGSRQFALAGELCGYLAKFKSKLTCQKKIPSQVDFWPKLSDFGDLDPSVL